MTLNNSMSITPSPPGQAKGAKFEHGSVLGGKTRAARVSSQWKATVLGAIPSFWLATLLVLVFSLHLKILPAGGYTPFLDNPRQNLTQMILPAVSLGLVSSALLLRIMRTTMIEVLSSDYVRTAHAKGAPEWIVLTRHALR